MIYRNIIVIVYLVCATVIVKLLEVLPYQFISTTFQLFTLSWLYSFYCFDYKIADLGLGTEKSIMIFESNWSFYAGFGFPFTLIIYFFPGLINSGLFALLFPILVCMSIEADPLKFKENDKLTESEQARVLVNSETTGNFPP